MSDKKKESILIKIYLVFLFVCGIAVWLTIQPLNKQISVDVELDKKIVDILVSNKIRQENVVRQFVKEKKSTYTKWNEFHKTIKLNKTKKMQDFEKTFRNLARSMKMGLSRLDNSDGSVTYKFYSPSRTYSYITFVKAKGRK
ncbi:MAG: hypothetical protein LBD17_01640 [Endomicrobium sp.]|nr:hypothetical protein [Endomicrobium sp.]